MKLTQVINRDDLRFILNYCRIHYGANGISDEYEEEVIARIMGAIENPNPNNGGEK